MSFDFARRLLLVVGLVASCSVKEDRSLCPCRMHLTLEGAPLRLRIAPQWGNGALLDCPRDTLISYSVSRGDVLLTAVRGAELEEDGSVRIPSGSPSPPLYLDCRSVDARGELAVASLYPRKSFCCLHLLCDGPPGEGPPFWVEFRGNVNGWMADGTLSEGDFRCRFIPDAEGSIRVNLPRQKDASLLMDILFSDRIQRTFALGEALEDAGYDWTLPDLEDRDLVLHLSLTRISLQSDLWPQVQLREIEI